MVNSMWQKCPVCDGRGIVPDTISYGSRQCHVCNGHGIISVISGMPPVHSKTTIVTSTGTNMTTNPVMHVENVNENYIQYKNELASGMFFEWHPELSGTWEIDEKLWLAKQNNR